MPVDISSDEQDILVNLLVEKIEDAEQAYDTRFKIAKEHYKNYNSIRSKRFYNGRSDIFVPLSFMVVETVVARIMRIIYSEPILMTLQGVGPSDKDREERLRALLHMQQKKIVKLWPKLLDYWRGKIMYGRSYAKMEWRTDYRTIKKTELVDSEGNRIDNLTEFQTESPELQVARAEAEDLDFLEAEGGISIEDTDPSADTPEDREITKVDKSIFPIEEGGIKDSKLVKVKSKEERIATYDCWDFKPLDFFDVLVDPMAPDGDIQRAEWISIRSLMSDDEVKKWGNTENSEGRPFFEMWQDSIAAGIGEPSQDLIDRKELLGLNVQAISKLRGDNTKHEVHEIYMDYKFEGEKYVSSNVLFVMLDRRAIVRAERNPFWHGRKPVVSGAYTRRPNEFLGQGILDPIRKIQYEINDKRNQELDYATFTLNPIWIVGDDAELDDENIRISSGVAIRVANVDAIRSQVFPDMTPVGQRAEALLENTLREATGVTRPLQGVAEPGRQTATEFTQLLAQGDERITMVLEAYGQQDWVEMWEMAHSLNQQFLKKDTFVRLTEREGKDLDTFGTEGEVTQADLAMDVDFIVPSFNDIASENVRNQQIIPFMQIVSQMPPSEGNLSFFNMFIEKLWVDVFKFPREDLIDDEGKRILLTPPGFKSIYDTSIKQEIDEGIAEGIEGAPVQPPVDQSQPPDAQELSALLGAGV